MLGAVILLLVLCTVGWTAQPRNNWDLFPSANVSTATRISTPQVTVYIKTTTTSQEREWLETTPRTFSETKHYAPTNDTDITNRDMQDDLRDGGPLESLKNLTSGPGSQPQAASRSVQSSISSSGSRTSEPTSLQTTTNTIPGGNFSVSVSVSGSVSKTPSFKVGVASVSASSSAAANIAQSPTHFKTDEIILSCILLYVVQDGDTCVSITGEFRFPLDDLFDLNPGLDPTCEHLQIGQMLCLRDNASSAFAAPPSPSPSTGIHDAATTTTPTMTRTTTPTTTATASSSTTTASSSRTFKDCHTYMVKPHETCEMIAERNKLSMKDFLGLNPDLRVWGDGNCPLDVGQSVCVQGPSGTIAPTPTTQPNASSTQGKGPSTPVSKGDHGSSHTPTSLEVIPIEPTGM